jgi:hypothetical protein
MSSRHRVIWIGARRAARALALSAGALLAVVGCEAGNTPGTGGAGGGVAGGTGGDTGAAGGSGGAAGGGGLGGLGGGEGCACSPGAHNERIFVMSDSAELWSYDVEAAAFEKVAGAGCGLDESPYSMAVDRAGQAWILYSESKDIRTLDVNAPADCADPGYAPEQAGFGLFGMAFAADGPDDDCVHLYALHYSGQGPFGEGPGIGKLGVLDPETAVLAEIGPTDFDGGELSGTADGRLFAFAGQGPAKLVEYEKTTATVLSSTPLAGFHKTGASAFAIFRGDVYFFTEAQPAGCGPCLTGACGSALAACDADPACAAEMACALAQGDIDDDCGGAMPAELIDCLFGPCIAQCFPPPEDKLSQVTRLAVGADPATMEPVAMAPIRIVGAGVSTCAEEVPR